MNGTKIKDPVIGVKLRLTPKCHPEIVGRGVEYSWGYGKLCFRRDFNDAVANNLRSNMMELITSKDDHSK